VLYTVEWKERLQTYAVPKQHLVFYLLEQNIEQFPINLYRVQLNLVSFNNGATPRDSWKKPFQNFQSAVEIFVAQVSMHHNNCTLLISETGERICYYEYTPWSLVPYNQRVSFAKSYVNTASDTK
jgi:hypothetical protein